jgi:Fe2+ or Zn2+ uptake regulation protein
MTDYRPQIVDWLRNRGYPCSVAAITANTDYSPSTVANTLRWAVKQGTVQEVQFPSGLRYLAVQS